MNPDLYGAWLTAGDRLQPVGDWALTHWDWLALPAIAVFAAWAIWKCLPHGAAYHSPNDAAAARRITRYEPRPEPGQPGHDDGLLLDAYLARYGDTGFQRLRDAIEQTRNEKPQP